jgi:hypothetical protein
MKTLKKYFDELPLDETDMLCEPEMAYTYENKKNEESILVGKFDEVIPKPQKILQPDDDLRRAITTEELVKRIHADIRRKFVSRS